VGLRRPVDRTPRLGVDRLPSTPRAARCPCHRGCACSEGQMAARGCHATCASTSSCRSTGQLEPSRALFLSVFARRPQTPSAGRHSRRRRQTPPPTTNHRRPSTPAPPAQLREASPSAPCPALGRAEPEIQLWRPAGGQPAAGARRRHRRPEPHLQSTQAQPSSRLGALPGRSQPEPAAGGLPCAGRGDIARVKVISGFPVKDSRDPVVKVTFRVTAATSENH
jgi:hypothetical protein